MRTNLFLLLINSTVGFIELVIGLRILLKLLSINPGAPFVSLIYETSQPLLTPFLGLFSSKQLSGSSVIEFFALFGFVAYAFLGYFLTKAARNLEYLTFHHRDKKS